MVAIQVPLSWIRDIRRLTPTNLLANLLILYGLTVCVGFALEESFSSIDGPDAEVQTTPVQNLGDHFHQLKAFADDWFLFIGTSVSQGYIGVPDMRSRSYQIGSLCMVSGSPV